MKVKVWKLLGLLFIFIFVLSVASEVYSEVTPSVAWSQTYSGFGEIASSVIQTKDNGYLMLCSDLLTTQHFSGVFYLLKVDSSGRQQWNRTLPGIIFDNNGQNVVQTADGGYALAAG
ncbi:MAG: hypothetical protein M1167_01455, partial [Chloroflexi bacterium]|nr:hypothetical protein [Chloroflexota bacterium]